MEMFEIYRQEIINSRNCFKLDEGENASEVGDPLYN